MKRIDFQQLNSPSYVFSERDFRNRASLVREKLGSEIDICFSIKANSFLLSVLPDEFSKVEVCSPGELEICKKYHIAPERIIFSGVNKSKADIQAALDYGVTTITVESRNHWNSLISCERPHGIEVLLRLSDESQFGMDEEVLVDTVKAYMSNSSDYSNISIAGIHYFTGTAKKKSKEITGEMARLEAIIDRLEGEAGFSVREVEYGPGLAVNYFASSDEEAEAWETALLEEIAPILKSFTKAHLTVEMGRFFAAPCGYYVTTIVDIKNNDGTNYMILDGGLHQLKYHGQLQGMQKPVITHIPASDNSSPTAHAEGSWTICGSLCTTQDVITRNYDFITQPQEGDRLVFHRVGAYSVTEGMALFLSRDLPSVYIEYQDGNISMVRKPIESADINS